MKIAIFGAPGSGKSTIALELIKKRSDYGIVEASVVVQKIAALSKLPRNYSDLLVKFRVVRPKVSLTREEAREIFLLASEKYGSDFVARLLCDFFVKNNCLIFTGLRGYVNAEYFRSEGFLVVFLKVNNGVLVDRLMHDRGYSKFKAEREVCEEEELYETSKIEKVSDLVFDTSKSTTTEIVEEIIRDLRGFVECKKCINTTKNPSIKINLEGYCNVCEMYLKNFDRKELVEEKKFFLSLRNPLKKCDALVGFSGGKDSSATLYTVKKLGFKPLAFTFDIGYYPKHEFSRARMIAKYFGVPHEVISIKKYIRKIDYSCYKKTAELYESPESSELKEKFLELYKFGRAHYSIKCRHVFPFVRTCQLCRRTVIRAYYAEALKHGVNVVVLGINEWARLSKSQKSGKCKISAIRKLQPYKNKPPVYIVHLPFLLQRNICQTKRILAKLKWKAPAGEGLVESNSNSCLFALAAEKKARAMLGFSPDSTRLAREVTVGFISKEQAKNALRKEQNYPFSVKYVLRKAGIL